MAGLTRHEAREILAQVGAAAQCDAFRDFHALPSAAVESILEAADLHKYRQPRNANGSRARYFHALLVRRANREES